MGGQPWTRQLLLVDGNSYRETWLRSQTPISQTPDLRHCQQQRGWIFLSQSGQITASPCCLKCLLFMARPGRGSSWNLVYFFSWRKANWMTYSPTATVGLKTTPILIIFPLLDSWTAATAGKSLQSCPTLCDPIDGSPTGSPVPGILQARTLEWVAISFSNAWTALLKTIKITKSKEGLRNYHRLPWWLRRWRICLPCRRPRFDPWFGKIPWRRKWLSTPIFLPRKSHGQRKLAC